MEHLLAALALVATLFLAFIRIAYLIDKEQHKQLCLRNARDNFLRGNVHFEDGRDLNGITPEEEANDERLSSANQHRWSASKDSQKQ